jgi:signal transduction histidine kinase
MIRPRLRSLRARLFLGIAAAVVVSIAISLATGALLVRRSVEQDAMKTLRRQVDLVVAQQPSPAAPRVSNLGLFFATQQERLAILSRSQALLLLPPSDRAALSAGRPAHGHVTVGGTDYLYAARPEGPRTVVLLRSAKLQAADWQPFWLAFLIAGLVGAALAMAAAFVPAQAVARPIGRVAAAARRLAGGEHPQPLAVEGADEVVLLAEAFNQMAAELSRAHEAERAFLLSVSHELKTPLTIIRGQAEALTEQLAAAPDAGEAIMREADRLDRLVRDLLDLARLNQRTFSVQRQRIDLADCAREAARRYETQARTFGVRLTVAAPVRAPATGDPDRVLQVLSNLIENALRCTPMGETLTVTAAAGMVAVEDTGPGLDAEDLRRAFERFFLYGRYGRDRPVGTGLGLAIVKELTEAMEGSVRVESTRGRGTKFVITLPRAPEEGAVGKRAGLASSVSPASLPRPSGSHR